MKKMFKCPVCGEKVISYKDKLKMNYRVKTTVKCKKCSCELTESNLGSIAVIIDGLIGAYIYFLPIIIITKIILFIISFILVYYASKYIVPTVKYRGK